MTVVAAEIGMAHDGSVALAHDYALAALSAGADAIKVQCRLASESWPEEPWRVEPTWAQDKSRYDYWQRMQFTQSQWASLAHLVRAHGRLFIASVFSVSGMEYMRGLVDWWKVPSGEITNKALLRALAADMRRVVVSTGMATWSEIERCVALMDECLLTLCQCTSRYPTPPEDVGLNVLDELMALRPSVGLSDHSGTIWPSVLAASLGAEYVEVHVMMDRRMSGIDAHSSVTIDELAQLVQGVRFVERLADVDKVMMADRLSSMRDLFMGRQARAETEK